MTLGPCTVQGSRAKPSPNSLLCRWVSTSELTICYGPKLMFNFAALTLPKFPKTFRIIWAVDDEITSIGPAASLQFREDALDVSSCYLC